MTEVDPESQAAHPAASVEPRDERRPTRTIVRFLVSLAVLVTMTWAGGYYRYSPDSLDVHADWLTASAALDGDAYEDVRTLAADVGEVFNVATPDGVVIENAAHPRLPGALVVQLGLLIVDYRSLWIVSLVVNIVGLSVLMAAGSQRFPNLDWALLAVGLVVSFPVYIALRYASQVVLIAVALLVVYRLARRRPIVVGTLLSILSSLKAFPAALVFGMVPVAGISAVITAVILNISGFALPGVNAEGLLATMSVATSNWIALPANGSLAAGLSALGLPTQASTLVGGFLGFCIMLGVNHLWRRRRIVDEEAWGALLVAGLLAIPLSWVAYDVVLIPFVWFLADRKQPVRLILLLWVGMFAAWMTNLTMLTPVVLLSRFVWLVVLLGPALIRPIRVEARRAGTQRHLAHETETVREGR